jgi:TonB family protein
MFEDPWLATYVEIVLGADGSLRGAGVVGSSGDDRYDLEALNAGDRADVIARYLADFHRHLHMQFAHYFIGSLPTTNSDLADPRLATEVEIVLEPSGKLHSLAIVRSSGNERYDNGALNAVHRGAPYPAPPAQFVSPGEKAYLHWRLLRNESQCGTWNAIPFILRKDAQ